MNPKVVAVMLTCNRQALAERAIRTMRNQTFPLSKVVLFDSGKFTVHSPFSDNLLHAEAAEGSKGLSVGKLRNLANTIAASEYGADIIVHADDDDWSHPNRIAEQVELLQSSKKQCVGYRDMLFWDEQLFGNTEGPLSPGWAWLYSNPDQKYCLGTSLCYWRSVWEQKPFPDLPKAKGATGEDVEWLKGVDSLGVPSTYWVAPIDKPAEPRMIASIHGDNTQYYGGDLLEQSTSWRRVPEWDQHCRERMAL